MPVTSLEVCALCEDRNTLNILKDKPGEKTTGGQQVNKDSSNKQPIMETTTIQPQNTTAFYGSQSRTRRKI